MRVALSVDWDPGLNKNVKAMEMWLSAQEYQLLLRKNCAWFPAPTWWLTTVLNASALGSDTLFCPVSTRYMHNIYVRVHTYIHTYTFIYIHTHTKCRHYTYTHKIEFKNLNSF